MANLVDFVHYQLAFGRQFRFLNVVDDVTWECLASIPDAWNSDTSITGRRVVRGLKALIERGGKPCMIVSGNGTELNSNAILTIDTGRKIEWRLYRASQTNTERFRQMS